MSKSEATALIVAGIAIPRDAEGRYDLNFFHQASEYAKDAGYAPSRWVRLKTSKKLVQALEHQKPEMASALEVKNGGEHPGTYAHELLAVSYAGWISAEFQLKVNQAFIDMRSGKALVPHMTQAEMLAAQAQLMVDMERRQLATEADVQQVKSAQQRQAVELAAVKDELAAVKEDLPPAGKLTPLDWMYRYSKPRLSPDLWKAFQQKCRALEPPERFQPKGAPYAWSYYSPETIAKAYGLAIRQLARVPVTERRVT